MLYRTVMVGVGQSRSYSDPATWYACFPKHLAFAAQIGRDVVKLVLFRPEDVLTVKKILEIPNSKIARVDRGFKPIVLDTGKFDNTKILRIRRRRRDVLEVQNLFEGEVVIEETEEEDKEDMDSSKDRSEKHRRGEKDRTSRRREDSRDKKCHNRSEERNDKRKRDRNESEDGGRSSRSDSEDRRGSRSGEESGDRRNRSRDWTPKKRRSCSNRERHGSDRDRGETPERRRSSSNMNDNRNRHSSGNNDSSFGRTETAERLGGGGGKSDVGDARRYSSSSSLDRQLVVEKKLKEVFPNAARVRATRVGKAEVSFETEDDAEEAFWLSGDAEVSGGKITVVFKR